MRLTALSARLASRWPRGDPRPPREPEVLLDAALRGEAMRLLEWLHLLRYKPDLDARFPDRAEPSAVRIWEASVGDDALRRLLLQKMAAGLCGGVGLCDSMVAAFHRHAPLASVEPLLQDVFAALIVLAEDPGAFVGVLIRHRRAPAAMLKRVGLPSSLPVMPALHAVLPDTLRSNPGAEGWLLASLSECTDLERDAIAETVLTGLSPETIAGLEDLSWWLESGYGRQQPGSRWRSLSEAALARLPA